MNNLLDILSFFRLTDEQDKISLTNIALIVVIVKTAMVTATSMEDIGVLLIPMLGYAYKKHKGK